MKAEASFTHSKRFATLAALNRFRALFATYAILLGPIRICVGAALETTNSSSLRDDWIDPDTGHHVLRLSRIPGESQSFYFHQNAFTEKGDQFVFSNTTEDARNRLFVLDWATRKVEPLTEPGASGGVVGLRSRKVYYQKQGTVYWTDLDSHETKEIVRLPRGWSAGTVNADETLLAGTFVAGGRSIDRSGPRSQWFEQTFEAKRPQCLFTLEIATGKTNIFYRYDGWLGHIQFSPADPQLLMFCHEGPWHKLDRIWTIRTDGGELRLMHHRTMTNEIAGHEFWSADGKMIWFDLQMPRGEKFFLAAVSVTNPENEIRYPLERDQWSVHFNISRDGKFFAGDGGAANMVAHAQNGKWIYLFKPQPEKTLQAERLVNMSKHDYKLEPNVNFSPDGKWIIFRGNFDGSEHVYAVEVARRQEAK